MFMDGRIHKDVRFTKNNFEIHALLIENPIEIFVELHELILICLWRINWPRISQDNLEEKKGRETCPNRF